MNVTSTTRTVHALRHVTSIAAAAAITVSLSMPPAAGAPAGTGSPGPGNPVSVSTVLDRAKAASEECQPRSEFLFPGDYESSFDGAWTGSQGGTLHVSASITGHLTGTVGVPKGNAQAITLRGAFAATSAYILESSSTHPSVTYSEQEISVDLVLRGGQVAADERLTGGARITYQLHYVDEDFDWEAPGDAVLSTPERAPDVSCTFLGVTLDPVAGGILELLPADGIQMNEYPDGSKEVHSSFTYSKYPSLALAPSADTKAAYDNLPQAGAERVARIMHGSQTTPATRLQAASGLLAYVRELGASRDCATSKVLTRINEAYLTLFDPIERSVRAIATSSSLFDGGKSREPLAMTLKLAGEWMDLSNDVWNRSGCRPEPQAMGRTVQRVARAYLKMHNRVAALHLDRVATATFDVPSLLPEVAAELQAEAQQAFDYLIANFTQLEGEALSQAVNDAVTKEGTAITAGGAGTGAAQWAADHGFARLSEAGLPES